MGVLLSKYIAKVRYILPQIRFNSVDDFIIFSKGLIVMILKISVVIRTDNLRGVISFKSDFSFLK